MTLFPCVPAPEKGLRPQLEPQQEPGLKRVLAVSLNGILLQVLRLGAEAFFRGGNTGE